MTASPAYRIDGRSADAGRFYAVACDPRRSVVVEACAGAGKTWMLVSRIVRALLDGAEPHQVLAITFTRKAAGEMRERLDDWLARFADPALDDAARAAELRLRGLDEAGAAALAPALARLQPQLLQAVRGIELRTFHGWFAQLLAHAPLALLDRLGLPPRHELIEDPSVLEPALMRRFHRAVLADPALHADYGALVQDHRRSTVQQWLATAWQRGTEIERADAAGTLEGAVPSAAAWSPAAEGLEDPRALVLRGPLQRELDALARSLGALPGKLAQKHGGLLRDALMRPDPGAALAGAWAALLTAGGEPRKNLGDLPEHLAACDRLREVQALHRQQQAHCDHGRMVRLARVLLAEFAAEKRERGLVDMADLERAALALLADTEASGWVQERLDQRVRHLLIDEFQDTSPLQWQALQGWLAAYAGAATAPSIFIVGDPKQSIYRFRRAEPRVFEAARRFVTEGLGGAVLECDHTRRNAEPVIAALNAVFAQAEAEDGWGPYRAHTTASDEAGAVRALPGVEREMGTKAAPGPAPWRDSLTVARREPETSRRRAEAAQVADAIAELVAREGVAPGQVMVLARQRSRLALVADALAARRLPCVMPEALDLGASPDALDLAAVLDVLASPGHDLSLARALKSPLFGAGDDALLWLARQARGRSWLDTMLAAQPEDAALARARTLLARWQSAARTLPPHDLLDRVVHEGDLLPRLAAAVPPARLPEAQHALRSLLAAALEHDGGRYASLYGLVRELRAGRLRAPGAVPAGAVQLLTVHGAKGLEARAVFVVDAEPEKRQADRASLLVDWPVDRSAPARLAFVASTSRVPPSLESLWQDESAARDREELNGLYVAMTRAREWLVFSRTEPRVAAAGSWWRRVAPQLAPWTPAAPEAAAAAAPVRIAVQAAPRRRAPAPPPPADVTDAAAARLGQAVHRALEWLGRPGAALEVAEAAQAAAAAFDADSGRVREVVERIWTAPALARFFGGPALQWTGNEVAFADAEGLMRLDRLVLLREGDAAPRWWVIDFKLGTEAAALARYAPQMARYLAAVRRAQAGAEVRGGFITGDGRFVESAPN